MAPEIRFVADGWLVVVSTHALFVVLAAVVGTALAVRSAREPALVLACAPMVVAAALVGSHLLYARVHGGTLVSWSGGLSSIGGIVAVAIVTGVASGGSRRRFAELADAIAPAGIAALGIGRIGCFLAGCCWGIPTGLPWRVVFPELGPPARHPLQLYSAALDLLLAVTVLRTGGPPGARAARAAIGLGVVRLLLEVLRDPAAADPLCCGGLRVAHLGAALLVVCGLAASRALRRPTLAT